MCAKHYANFNALDTKLSLSLIIFLQIFSIEKNKRES